MARPSGEVAEQQAVQRADETPRADSFPGRERAEGHWGSSRADAAASAAQSSSRIFSAGAGWAGSLRCGVRREACGLGRMVSSLPSPVVSTAKESATPSPVVSSGRPLRAASVAAEAGLAVEAP